MNIILNERTESDVISKILSETFCPAYEKVMAIKDYLDRNFRKTTIDDVDENGYPSKTRCAVMVSDGGKPLRTMQPREIILMLDDKFQNIISDKNDRIKFLRQTLKDWLDGKISASGILSVNHIE